MKSGKDWALVALIAISGVALTLGLQHLTVDYAARQVQAQQRLALIELLPVASYDNSPLDQPLAIHAQPLSNSLLHAGYLATLSGQPIAVLLRVQASGYVGPIELLIAIDPGGKLLGVKPLEHSETPSLGGRIAEPGNPWIAALKGHSGEFDHMAGATITSRAVINAVHDALRYFDEHRSSLLEPTPHE